MRVPSIGDKVVICVKRDRDTRGTITQLSFNKAGEIEDVCVAYGGFLGPKEIWTPSYSLRYLEPKP